MEERTKKRRIKSAPVDIGRTFPHSVEAEQGVLGSMLISRDVIGECVERIDEEFFYVPAHQTIYQALKECWGSGHAIDLITFTQLLRDANLLDAVGGAAFITSLFTFVPTAANVAYYLEIVREKYILRRIIATCTESVRRAYEEQDEVNLLLDEVERKALAIRPNWKQAQSVSMKELTMEGLEGIEQIYQKRGTVTGLATGFVELDRMTNGLQREELIVIAARPSMGKTALAMNIAEHVAVDQGKPVQVFSLEMSKQQLMQRLLCSRARLNLQKLRDGFLADRDFPALTAAAAKLAEAPLFIDDEITPCTTIIARARRAKRDHGIELIVIDYLQLIKETGFKVNERQHEVAHISGSIKRLAKELHIPIIVLAQLNRDPEKRGGGRPRISDLRESGAIEQDADIVGLIYRPEVYAEDEEARCEMSGEAELIIPKQRNGPVGQVALTFLKEFTRFEDRARNIL